MFMEIKLTTENNVEITLPKEYVELVKQGLYIEISKKKHKDTYTYFSTSTICSLLFLSKEISSYQLKKLISKDSFPEFFYDLVYTDLKAVFWLDIGGKKENLYKYYDEFLKYKEQVEGEILDVERTMPLDVMQLFYDHIKDYDIGLYSTVESLYQFKIYKNYKQISIGQRSKDDSDILGFNGLISYIHKFVGNQIADDILKEYIDEFEHSKLNKDKSKIIEETYGEDTEGFVKSGAILKKQQITNYYNYKKLIAMVGNIFGSDYENSGDILSVNNGILLNNQNLSKGDVEKIRLYELLLILEDRNDIKINKITCKNCEFSINIEFLKNPKDISSDSANWITYGDLRVNKDLGLGQYKNKPIKKFNKNSNKFKVLCYLIEHPDTVVNVTKLIEITNLTNDFRAYRKIGKSAREIHNIITERLPKYIAKLKDYRNDIQKDLGIVNDTERTIQISQAKPGFILHKI